MKLAGEYVFDAAVQDVWDALFDPAVLAAAMPGCEKLELVDGAYVGDIVVKIGPIQGKFTGKVDLSDKVEPTSYKMIVDGRGAQGFVKATATIVLEPVGAGTRIRYDADAQIGGKIASVGQRLVETSAKAIVKQSLDGLDTNIKRRVDAYRLHNATTAPLPKRAPKRDAAAATATVEPAPAIAPTEPAPAIAPTEPAPVVAQPAPAPTATPKAPVVEYQRADAGKLAATVAKEVTKSIAPIIGVVLLVIAIVVYLIVR